MSYDCFYFSLPSVTILSYTICSVTYKSPLCWMQTPYNYDGNQKEKDLFIIEIRDFKLIELFELKKRYKLKDENYSGIYLTGFWNNFPCKSINSYLLKWVKSNEVFWWVEVFLFWLLWRKFPFLFSSPMLNWSFFSKIENSNENNLKNIRFIEEINNLWELQGKFLKDQWRILNDFH